MTEDKALAEVNAAFGGDASAILTRYGVKSEDIKPAHVNVVQTTKFEELCTIKSVIEYNGSVIDHDGHSGPLMLLVKPEIRTGDEFEDYDGYGQLRAMAPGPRELLISYSIAEIPEDTADRPKDDLTVYFDSLSIGAIFTIAAMRTRSGYHVYRPVPAQKPAQPA